MLYCVAHSLTHSGHATLSQYLRLSGPATIHWPTATVMLRTIKHRRSECLSTIAHACCEQYTIRILGNSVGSVDCGEEDVTPHIHNCWQK